MSKLGLLAAGAVGYVLGARAGRERYDQIVYAAQRFWTNPKVQRAASEAQERAREAVPVVAEKVGDAAKHAAGAAVSAVKGDGGETTTDDGASGSTSATRDESTRRAGSTNGSGSHATVSHL
jgi:hypothetical protein